MPHVSPFSVHRDLPLVLDHQGPGMGLGVTPILTTWASGEGMRAIWRDIKNVFAPQGIEELPVQVTPAAPQSYGTLTIPGAWSPEEMMQQTYRQQQVANQSYQQGSRSGYEIGKELGGTEPDHEGEIYMAVFLALAAGLGLLMVTRSRSKR